MTRLSLDRVTFRYPATEAPALEDVSLEVAAGEVVALVGSVGAGASTLLLVAGDLAPRVVGGRLEGRVIFDGAGGDLRGIVLPMPWTQLSGMAFTVWDEVAFGPANLGLPRDEIVRQVDRAVARLGIEHLVARDPTTLSGGELQRVIVAGILAMRPTLLLLDEPTAELDLAGARTLWELVRALASEGTAILVATSDLDALPDVADRLVWLDRGRVAETGPVRLLASDEMLAANLSTTVASVWRAADLPAPYPVTVAQAMQRWQGR
ncbi:MAG TPA: ABC transporter ATP-binding protein [Gemmatimonadales bacterium]|nr:ABC transporter ATP-binding protein [Gemmatimonadales bacterium]